MAPLIGCTGGSRGSRVTVREFYGYDSEGRLTSGDSFTYVYDTMGRTSPMRKQEDDTLFASATPYEDAYLLRVCR